MTIERLAAFTLTSGILTGRVNGLIDSPQSPAFPVRLTGSEPDLQACGESIFFPQLSVENNPFFPPEERVVDYRSTDESLFTAQIEYSTDGSEQV